jgi:hypothetical protein
MPEMKSLGELWNKTWEIYFKTFWSTLSLVLVLGWPLIILCLASPYSMFQQKIVGMQWIFFIVYMLVSIILGTIMYLALTHYIYKSSNKSKVTIVDSIRFALSKFWTTIGTSLLVILMLIGLFILLIVPGIIFAVYWTFVIPVIVIKNLSGKKALDYSKSVVKKRWWKVLGYSIVLVIIPMVALLIVSMLLSFGFPNSNLAYSIYFLISLMLYVFVYLVDVILFLEFDRTKAR